jgi:acylphosphatase
MTLSRAHVFVRGLVQGVNFRYYTRLEALDKGVTGWVRNLSDGRVEAVFEGEESAVRNMVDWCWRGPPVARVDDVEVVWEDHTGSFDAFSIHTTYFGEQA